MKTNEMIFADIKESGFITKSNLQLLKNRSNKEQKDLFDYDFMEKFKDGFGIPLPEEQGKQGLKWLKKFIRKDGSSNVYGYREIDIIRNASPSDFKFRGFYDNGNRSYKNYLPIYELNGMQYVPLLEPYIIG
jgi:hypothetical protein